MYVAAIAVVVVYSILFLFARKEKPGKVPSGLLLPFYRIAIYLYKLVCIKKIPIAGRNQAVKDLERLYPGESKEAVCTDYYVEKIAKSLLIIFIGTILGTAVSAKSEMEKVLGKNGTIARGTYAEGGSKLQLEAHFESGGRGLFDVEVGAQTLSEKEAEALAAELSARLPLLILGENASLQEVTGDLVLEESYEEYPFWLEWHSDRPDIVTGSGTVYEVLEGEEQVMLTAQIVYEELAGLAWEQEIVVCVVPPTLTEEEAFQREMEEALALSERESRGQEEWQLPESFQGTQILWSQRVTDYGPLLWSGALLTAVLIFFLADKDMHDKLEAKRMRMKRAYPDVVQKLVLYMGAGLTVRGAFQRIAGSYEQEKRAGKAERPIYEEILYTCRELQAGVSEGAAYEHFGKRTGLQEYIRLSTLLMQNLKKGNSTLLQRLKEEADKAGIEQLQNSRRLGEEASTKLLLPMVMMLVVVMLMIMIPAFSSVGT